MSTTLTTVIKRLTVINGILQPDDPYLDKPTTQGKSAKAGKGSLFVFVETQGPGAEGTRHALSELITQTYFRDQSVSITSRLTRAIREAGVLLSAAQVPGRQYGQSGVNCLVLRDDDCYVAQAGPAFTLIAHRSESYMSTGVDVFAEPDAAGIEFDSSPDVRLYRTQVRVGDLLIVGSPTLKVLSDSCVVGSSLRGKSADQAKQTLYDLWLAADGHGDFEALLIEITDERELEFIPTRESRRNQGHKPEQDRQQRNPATRRTDFNSTNTEDDWSNDDDFSVKNERENPQRGIPAQLPGDMLVDILDGAGKNIKKGFRIQAKANQTSIFKFLTFAVVAAMVFGAVFFGVRWWQSQQTQTTILNTIDDAENKEREAQDVTEPAKKRQLLLEAQGLAQKAEELASNDRNVMALKQRLQGELDALGEIARVSATNLVVNLGTFHASNEPKTLVQAQDHLFVLDPPTQTVFHFELKDSGKSVGLNSNPSLVRRGDTIGNIKIGGLVAMTWIPAGGQREQGSLVCLDDKSTLFEYNPTNGLNVLSLRDVGLSGEAPILGGYAGNLYVLDTAANRLQWLPPTTTGYDRIVYDYLSAGQVADFSTVVAMTVDSNVYMLSKNGMIYRFFGGKAQTFDLATPDIPLKKPTALAVGSETHMLYILDSGNERVVTFSTDGHFQRQIRSTSIENPFRNATSLAVDESKGRLYVLRGNIVYSVELN